VLKTNPDDPVIHGENIVLFKKEYEILSRLNHPGLPKAYDYFEEDGNYFLVVQYMEGKNLERSLTEKNEPFQEAEVVDWGIKLTDILLYLYHIKPYPVVVRDIKPSNILVSEDGKISLIDFTVAKEMTSHYKEDTVRIGSRGYAPPEQYKGLTDHKSDIYALGATLYRLLTGEDPSNANFRFKPLREINPDFSRKLEYVILKAIELSPEKRYQTPEELHRDLIYVKDELVGIAHPEFVVPEIIYSVASEKKNTTDVFNFRSFIKKAGMFILLILILNIIFRYNTIIVTYFFFQADNLIKKNDIKGAISVYENILQIKPDNLEATYRLGVLLIYQGDTVTGQEYLSKLCNDLNRTREKLFYHHKLYEEYKTSDPERGRKDLEIARFLSEIVKKSVEIKE